MKNQFCHRERPSTHMGARLAMTKSGFTLVELLSVIAIIGVLAALSLGPLEAARKRGRDAQRKDDLNLIAQELDAYYADNRTYPRFEDCKNGAVLSIQSNQSATDPWIKAANDKPDIKNYLVPSQGNQPYLMPKDPRNNGSYYYRYTPCVYDSSGSGRVLMEYKLEAHLENKADKSAVFDGTDYVYTIKSK